MQGPDLESLDIAYQGPDLDNLPTKQAYGFRTFQ